MNRQFREAIWKAGFKPVEELLEFDSKLRARLGLTNRYDSARLAIGRSLAEVAPLNAISVDTAFGKPIAGEHLFGEQIDLWICGLILHGGLGSTAKIDDFRALVEAHWARGLKILKDEFDQCAEDETKFISRLSDLLPEKSLREEGQNRPIFSTGEIRIKAGAISKTFFDNSDVDIVLNGQGTSPHIALMGKVGSGKTTTGLQIAAQIVSKSRIPALFIDPKGEFVIGGQLSERMDSIGFDIHPIEVGNSPIPLDFLPSPEVGSVSIQNAAMQFRDSIALCCKGAGNIQQDLLRTAIERVIRSSRIRNLEAVKKAYKYELELNNKSHDSIMSRLNELTGLECFEPRLQPAEFFAGSWILSLKSLQTEELKRLVILLVLDALKTFLLSQNEAPVVNGFRGLRHLLVIDEARKILAQKKYQSLVDLVRQGRSKGAAIILLSQDPSDFDAQADDFTTQLGTVIAFACSQSSSGLRALQGVYGRKVLPNEFTDIQLPPGVAFCKLPSRLPEKIICWSPEQNI